MKKHATNIAAILVVILLIVAGILAWGSAKNTGVDNGAVACTMDAKICPDGSAVGRTGPRCEFAACPTGTVQDAEARLVEWYIREDIVNIAPTQPVLGGTWYVTDVVLDTESNTGVVTYEDGHIQNRARFSYQVVNEMVFIRTITEIK